MKFYKRASKCLSLLALLAGLAAQSAMAKPSWAGGGDDGGDTGGGGGSDAGTVVEVTNFGSNPGNLKMYRYVPTSLASPAPVVVAMHGCWQSAADWDDEPGWTKLAEQWGFILVLPEQQKKNNSWRCFNWFDSADQNRDQGEALSIKQMVDHIKANYSVDSSRVFASGLSAGGAMTAVMLAAYPDVFAGGGISAGIPYKCATSGTQASGCSDPGVDKTPPQWGDLVRGATSHAGPWPKVSIWHGTEDGTVRPMNMTELMEQWTDVHGTDQYADVQETVQGYPHRVYTNASGVAVVETYELTGLDHAQAVDLGAAAERCGSEASYIKDWNICAAYYMGHFWGLGQ
jgi:poly(hydroxyalkanoate) depolymerase family esterase